MGCREWAELASMGSTGRAQNCLASLSCVHESLSHQWEDERGAGSRVVAHGS